MIYWFTGQPGAGKTTLANELVKYLKTSRKDVLHIDGDDLREILRNKDYSEEGRRKNVETAQNIAKYLSHKQKEVVVSLVSPFKDQRESLKGEIPVIEILVSTSEIRGREKFHVEDYDPPTENFISIDTTNKKLEESFIELINYMDI